MDWLEQELKQALARKDPSPDFADRVVTRATSAATRHRPMLPKWLATAATTTRLISIAGERWPVFLFMDAKGAACKSATARWETAVSSQVTSGRTLRLLRLESLGLRFVHFGFVQPAELGERAGEIKVCLGVLRFDSGRFRKVSDGFRQIAQPGECRARVEIGSGVVRIDLQRLVILVKGLLRKPTTVKNVSEIPVCLPILRIQSESLIE